MPRPIAPVRASALRIAVFAGAWTIASAGCTTGTDPFTPIRVDGVVTVGGAPVRADVTLTAGNFRTSGIFPDGAYSLTLGGGGIPESSCPGAQIEAAALAEDGTTVLHRDSRLLGGCGTHEVDFAF